jgi:hypothetical protein
MQPMLHESAFGFFSFPEHEAVPLMPEALGFFRESEGFTLILPSDIAVHHSLELEQTWAMITLNVHSSLLAVGFLAAISSALASSGISLNAISAYYHDHLFVPWQQRFQALSVLNDLAKNQSGA